MLVDASLVYEFQVNLCVICAYCINFHYKTSFCCLYIAILMSCIFHVKSIFLKCYWLLQIAYWVTSLHTNCSQSKKGTGPPVKYKTILAKAFYYGRAHSGSVPLRTNSKSLLSQ